MAQLGDWEICQLLCELIDGPVDSLEAFDQDGMQPLHIAAHWGHVEAVEVFN